MYKKLKSLEDNANLNVQLKLQVIVKQLQLVFMNVKHRWYTPDLLRICILWENTSPNLYKQIRDEGSLTITSTRYIKNNVIFTSWHWLKWEHYQIPWGYAHIISETVFCLNIAFVFYTWNGARLYSPEVECMSRVTSCRTT